MAYMLLGAVIVLGSLQSVFLKKYQRGTDGGLIACLWAVLGLGAVMALVMALFSLGTLSVRTPTVLCALLFAFSGIGANVCFVRGVSLGQMSAMNVFLMLGGIALPFLYGVTLLSEPLTLMKLIGLSLIVLSVLCRPVLEKRGEKKRTGGAYYLFGAGCFLFNGVCSALIKLHQQFETRASDASFLFFAGLFYVALSAASILFITLRSGGRPLSDRSLLSGVSDFTPGALASAFLAVALYGLCNSVTNLCAMGVASLMDSSVQFPLQNSGIIVVTMLMGMLFYREKPDRIDLAGMALAVAAIISFVL